MPRSATKTTSSRPVTLRERNEKALDLEKKITVLTKNDGRSSSGDSTAAANKANNLRVPLCEVLSDIMLEDPAFAYQHDVPNRLWRHCFYSRIGPHRARITKMKRKLANATSTSTGQQLQQQQNVLEEVEKSLTFFLSEAITMYDFLNEKLRAKLPGVAEALGEGGSEISSQASPSAASGGGYNLLQKGGSQQQQRRQQQRRQENPSSGVVECLHLLFIHLGDLHRYREAGPTAQECYMKAAALGPGYGHSYNQTAVLCQLKDPQLAVTSLYWYARSLLATVDVFKTARVNLGRLLQSNRDWLAKRRQQEEAPGGGTNGGDQLPKSERTKRFLGQFVDLHYQFFLGVRPGAECSTVAADTVDTMRTLSELLNMTALSDTLLIKLVTIAAFSEHYPPPDLEQKVRDEAEKREILALSWLSARMATLGFGRQLADRLLAGPLPKWLQQQQQQGSASQQQAPSVRLLLPLLLTSEYLANNPIRPQRDTAGGNHALLLEQHDRTWKDFWKRFVDVWNLFHRFAVATGGDVPEEERSLARQSLKEYQNLRGYQPFARGVRIDSETTARVTADGDDNGEEEDDPQRASPRFLPSGFVSDVEAVRVLGLQSTIVPLEHQQDSSATTVHTQASSSSSSSSQSAANDYNQNRIKVARFLVLGRQLAEGNRDTTAAVVDPRLAKHMRMVPGPGSRPEEEEMEWTEKPVDYRMDDVGEGPMDDVYDPVGASATASGILMTSSSPGEQRGANFSSILPGMGGVAAPSAPAVPLTTAAAVVASQKKDKAVADDDDNMLVYQPGTGGGPPLLVPGAFLQGQAVSENKDRHAPAVIGASVAAPTGLLPGAISTLGQSLAEPTTAPQSKLLSVLDKRTSSNSSSNNNHGEGVACPTTGLMQAPGAVPMAGGTRLAPPPGFGAAPSTPSVPVGGATGPFSGLGALQPHQQQHAPIPTFAESMELFGGQNALPGTANPFAFSSSPSATPATVAVGPTAVSVPAPTPGFSGPERSRLFGTYMATHEDTSFLSSEQQQRRITPGHHNREEEAVGPDGATLLDSSLLDSLMMDDSNNNNGGGGFASKTKNPFFT